MPGEDSSDFIQLYINSTQKMNGTIVRCINVPGLSETTDISETVLIVYGML